MLIGMEDEGSQAATSVCKVLQKTLKKSENIK